MKGMLCVLCFLVLSFPVSAGPLHFKKRNPIGFVKHHKLLLVTSAIYLASDFADTETTIQAQRRCPTCVESSAIYEIVPGLVESSGSRLSARYATWVC